MSKAGSDIWLEGERDLFMNMQKHLVSLTDNSRKGLRKAGMNIIADAKVNLRNNGSVVTGMLRASGRVQAVDGDQDSIDVGFFGNDTQGGYAAFVEYGRRSGKMPPIKMLAEWARKKLRLDEKSAKSVGFLIARKIAKAGTKPHPFFQPAIAKNMKAINEAIAESIKEDL